MIVIQCDKTRNDTDRVSVNRLHTDVLIVKASFVGNENQLRLDDFFNQLIGLIIIESPEYQLPLHISLEIRLQDWLRCDKQRTLGRIDDSGYRKIPMGISRNA